MEVFIFYLTNVTITTVCVVC